jgi:hypothetical protein
MSANESLARRAVFASLNLSPVFEVVAMLAEGMVLNGEESHSKQIAAASDLALPQRNRQRSVLAVKMVPVQSSGNLSARSDSNELHRTSPISLSTLHQRVLG